MWSAAEILDKFQNAANDAQSSLTKSADWTLAALLAINGGALIAILGAINRVPFSIWDFLCFAAGVTMTLLSAIAGNIISFSRAMEFRSFVDQIKAAEEGVGDHPNFTILPQRWYVRLRNVPFGLRIAATILFVVGSVLSGTDVYVADRKLAPTCRQVEADMMALKPRRSDSPAVFQAFGCRAQGGIGEFAPPAKSGARPVASGRKDN